jgi:glycosyltransferase involved in cell wall biosynthesis
MKRLRIGIISSLYTSLPPKKYGGIERVVCAVSDALHARGHEVTLFGPDEIESSCRSFAFGRVLGEQQHDKISHKMRLWKLLHQHRREFDVVHDFFRTAYLLPILPYRVAKLISYACPLNSGTIRMTDFLGGRSIHYSVCGRHMLNQLNKNVDRSKWHVVYNPIDVAPYTLTIQPDSSDPYLVFLSRLMEAKGAHRAIEVAKLTGKRLVIAGNVQPSDRPYFESRVKPFIDGKQIQFVGAVDNAAKNKLLGNAEAMLFPIEWEEPFGLVVGEAMACGTPVLAFNRGAMKEIIDPGKTGILCASVAEMATAVGKIGSLDRKACRASIESRFSPDMIATDYEKIYMEMLR